MRNFQSVLYLGDACDLPSGIRCFRCQRPRTHGAFQYYSRTIQQHADSLSLSLRALYEALLY